MPKLINDDELIRLTSESEKISNRLNRLRQRKAEHESAMTKLDGTHWEMVQRIRDITEQLNRASDELRSLAYERTKGFDALRHLAGDIKETAKRGRALRRSIQDGVGRDVCPKCGSAEIAAIMYGYPIEEPDDDLFEPDYVLGGCCIESDETVCCTDCGLKFLGNFEKWERSRKASGTRETVLEVGAEGGCLAIVRQQNRQGIWEYQSLVNETTIIELLPESELEIETN